MSTYIQALVAIRGVKATADLLLRAKDLDRESEDFLSEHLEQLPWRFLFYWLTHDPPEGAGERPYGRIIARIAETIDANEARLGLFSDPDVVRRVRDADAREELIDALRSKNDPNPWLRNLAFASTASDPFNAVRDIEARVFDNPGLVRGIATPDGPYTWLFTPGMFADRRDPEACLRMLRGAALDPATRHYALWLLDETGLLRRVGSPIDELLGDAPTQSEIENDDQRDVETEHRRVRVRLLVRLAGKWLDAEARRRWFVRRYMRAAEAGARWNLLWCEIEPDLRDDVAIASLEIGRPAPWAMAALVRRLKGGIEAWNRAFAVLDSVAGETEGEAQESPSGGLASVVSDWTRRPIGAEDLVQARRDFYRPRDWISRCLDHIVDMPLPIDANDDFDARLLRLCRRFPDHGIVPDDYVARALQHLPLTPSRARRILDLTLSSGHFWDLEKVAEIARAVGKTTEPIPLPHDWVLLSATTVAAFHDLVGADVANERLGQWLDDLVNTGNLGGALRLVALEPSILIEGRRAALRQLGLKQPVDHMLELRNSCGWLVTESDVVAAVVDETNDWRWLRWSAALSLPQFLTPIAEARAVSVVEADTATLLLDHLEKLFRRPRRAVLALALERVRKNGPSSLPPEWLAAKLDTKSLLEEPGEAIVGLLLSPYDQAAKERVWVLCITAADRWRDARLDGALHTVLGSVLVDVAGRALRSGECALAERALRGLAHLSPAPRLWRSVRALRKHPSSDAVLSIIEINEGLLRRSATDSASVYDIHDALRALVDGDADDDAAQGDAAQGGVA